MSFLFRLLLRSNFSFFEGYLAAFKSKLLRCAPLPVRFLNEIHVHHLHLFVQGCFREHLNGLLLLGDVSPTRFLIVLQDVIHAEISVVEQAELGFFWLRVRKEVDLLVHDSLVQLLQRSVFL